MALILLLAAVAEVLVVLFVRKPFPWVAVIPVLIPLFTCVLVVLPMMMAEKPAPPSI